MKDDEHGAEWPGAAQWRNAGVLTGEVRITEGALRTLAALALDALTDLEDYVDCWEHYGGEAYRNQHVLGGFQGRAYAILQRFREAGLVMPEYPHHPPGKRLPCVRVVIAPDIMGGLRRRRAFDAIQRLLGFVIGYAWSCDDDLSIFPRIDATNARYFATNARRLKELAKGAHPPLAPTDNASEGVDHKALVRALRERNWGQTARLVEYMEHRQQATYEEMAEHVHDNLKIADGAIRKMLTVARQRLVELGSPLSFRTVMGHVVKEVLPE